MSRIMSTYLCQVSFCFVGGLICLLPFMIPHESKIEGGPLRAALPSQENRETSIASVSIMIPLVLDMITEMINSLVTEEKKIKKRRRVGLLNTAERMLFLCGVAVVPMTAFLPTNTPNWAYVYVCCQHCQFTLVGGAINISLCRYEKKYWTVSRTYFILFLLVVGSVTGAFTDNYLLEKKVSTMIFSIQIVSISVILLSILIFICCSMRWLRVTVPILILKFYDFISRKPKECIENTYPNNRHEPLLYPVIYVVVSIAAAITLVALSTSSKGSAYYDSKALYNHNLSSICYLLFITYGSMRMTKDEMVQGLYALIESKKMYARYISHELRTPLNSACLGLKLVCDEIELSKLEQDAEQYETLLDVKAACKTAVEILNDLLCFDKLESGILEVHKLEVPVLPYILENINMFTSQAKGAGITMSVITPHYEQQNEQNPSQNLSPNQSQNSNQNSNKSHHTSTNQNQNQNINQNMNCRRKQSSNSDQNEVCAVLSTDIVVMDKFKMDQVLRNLLSNALKFTPRGGHVSVSTSFRPDKNQSIKNQLKNQLQCQTYSMSRNVSSREMNIEKRSKQSSAHSSVQYLSSTFITSFYWWTNMLCISVDRTLRVHSSRISEVDKNGTSIHDIERAMENPLYEIQSDEITEINTDTSHDHNHNHFTLNVNSNINSASNSNSNLFASHHCSRRINPGNENGKYANGKNQDPCKSSPGQDRLFFPLNRQNTISENNILDEEDCSEHNTTDNESHNTPQVLSARCSEVDRETDTEPILSTKLLENLSQNLSENRIQTQSQNQSSNQSRNHSKRIQSQSNSRRQSEKIIDEYISGKLIITVTDTGVGLSKENQLLVFKEIVQFNPEVQQAGGGSGLGLWITRSLIDMHDGAVEVHSDGLGKGCSFTVEIAMKRLNRTYPSEFNNFNNLKNSNIHYNNPIPDSNHNNNHNNHNNNFNHNNNHINHLNPIESIHSTLCSLFTSIPTPHTNPTQTNHIKLNPIKSNNTTSPNTGRLLVPDNHIIDMNSPHKPINSHNSSPSKHITQPLEIDQQQTLSQLLSQSQLQSNPMKIIEKMKNGSPQIGQKICVTGAALRQFEMDSRSSFRDEENDKNQLNIEKNGKNTTKLSVPKPENSPAFLLLHCLKRGKNGRVGSFDSSHTRTLNSAPQSPRINSCYKPGNTENSITENTEKRLLERKRGPCHDLLVVDDSTLNRKMLCRVLRAMGHVCEEAEDGLIAIEKLKIRMANTDPNKKNSFGAILMDFVMPNLDGPSAARIMRDMGYEGLIFGVTGNALDCDVNHFLHHGANDVIKKPFEYSVFERLMKNADSTLIENVMNSEKIVKI